MTFCILTPGKPVADVEATVHFMLSPEWVEELQKRWEQPHGCCIQGDKPGSEPEEHHVGGSPRRTPQNQGNGHCTASAALIRGPAAQAGSTAGDGRFGMGLEVNTAEGHVAFRFEGQNLIHTPTRTLLASKFEFWLDRYQQTWREG